MHELIQIFVLAIFEKKNLDGEQLTEIVLS